MIRATAAAAVAAALLAGGCAAHADEPAAVVRVVDGDTLVVAVEGGEQRVRLLGIDTPERGQCGWRQAGDNLRRLAPAGAAATLAGDSGQPDRDRYGRLLRRVTVSGEDLSVRQVGDGWAALPARYPVSFTPQLQAELDRARGEARGAWGVCPR